MEGKESKVSSNRKVKTKVTDNLYEQEARAIEPVLKAEETIKLSQAALLTVTSTGWIYVNTIRNGEQIKINKDKLER